MMNRFNEVLEEIDRINAEDPHLEVSEKGIAINAITAYQRCFKPEM